jgi:hypothetical protein
VRELSFESRFAIGALATWRLVHLIAHEDGPGDVIVRLRVRVGDSPVGSLMDCFDCLSVWIAAPFALTTARRRRDVAPTWLALSAAACLLERATRDPFESVEGRAADGLLWPETASA